MKKSNLWHKVKLLLYYKINLLIRNKSYLFLHIAALVFIMNYVYFSNFSSQSESFIHKNENLNIFFNQPSLSLKNYISFMHTFTNTLSTEDIAKIHHHFRTHALPTPEEDAIFDVYICLFNAGSTKNLADKLIFLEKALTRADNAIFKFPKSIGARFARYTVHSNIPYFFSDRNKLKDDNLFLKAQQHFFNY